MEEYNLLICEAPNPGIVILRTSAYRGIINNRPGLRHENLGNFYSEVACENLATRTNEIIEVVKREKFFSTDDLAGDVVWNLLVEMAQLSLGREKKIVKAPFSLPDNPDTDYIIKYNKGVRIYCPQTFIEGVDPTFQNAALAVFLLHGLSNDKEGTAMKAFDSFTADIEQYLTETRKELAGLYKMIAENSGGEKVTEKEDEEALVYLALFGETMKRVTEISRNIQQTAGIDSIHLRKWSLPFTDHP